MYPRQALHHCSWLAALATEGCQPAGRKPGPVAREQEKWNKVRLEKPSMVIVYIILRIIHYLGRWP